MTHPSSCHNCFEKCPRPTENVGALALFLFATRQYARVVTYPGGGICAGGGGICGGICGGAAVVMSTRRMLQRRSRETFSHKWRSSRSSSSSSAPYYWANLLEVVSYAQRNNHMGFDKCQLESWGGRCAAKLARLNLGLLTLLPMPLPMLQWFQAKISVSKLWKNLHKCSTEKNIYLFEKIGIT